MHNIYKKICIVHALDDSTAFLRDIRNLKPESYVVVGPENEDIDDLMEVLKSIEQSSLIIFLGHGHSSGLYCSDIERHGKRTMINAVVGNIVFKNHDVLLLSCNSNEFIQHLQTPRSVIGFGNILSSFFEVENEGRNAGEQRDLSSDDIDYFNSCYVEAVSKSLDLLINNKITFRALPKWIAYFINKSINFVLRNRDKDNRREVARLLFDFRNEILCK